MVSFVPMEALGIMRKEIGETHNRPLSEVQGSYTYFADGDVLLAKITPCFENGKLGIASGLTNGVGFGSSEYIVLRPAACLTADFLYYFLLQNSFRETGARNMTGTAGQKRVTKTYVESSEVPVPSLTAQERIVAILDEAFEGIATAKANAVENQKVSRALFDSFRFKMFKPTSTWDVVNLPDISENLDARRVPVTRAVRAAGPYPYYGASGIVDYVDDFIFDFETLLVSEDGANLIARSTPVAFPASGKYWVNNHAHILRFKERATQKFVQLYLESIPLDRYITGTAQPKLNQSALNSIPIPIPISLEERAEVVRRCELLSTECGLLDKGYQRKLSTLEGLKQSLLHQAFTGKL